MAVLRAKIIKVVPKPNDPHEDDNSLMRMITHEDDNSHQNDYGQDYDRIVGGYDPKKNKPWIARIYGAKYAKSVLTTRI